MQLKFFKFEKTILFNCKNKNKINKIVIMYGKGHKVEKRSRLKHALVSNAQVCVLNNSTHREQSVHLFLTQWSCDFWRHDFNTEPKLYRTHTLYLSASLHLTGNC